MVIGLPVGSVIFFAAVILIAAAFSAYLLTRQGVRLDRAGITVRAPFPLKARTFPWSDLHAVELATMPTGKPGLRLIGVGQGASWVCPSRGPTSVNVS
jgi:hypothetical protein